ncbi:hypothetical protein EHQ53_06195 [Leptospira langatensis]|uniref:Uncharacterized protein n=1 Tax=Leptospira langatensis TaxID=2484983 RepID=A0A5F1ZVX6_9LEPT|nr:hypothetical protein [Leptospira langatensis]TGK03045.1 hypothetical protein EHO57_07030 [Leptospira langatensis]TGL41801.1 hypothetical protein EHQ53_06195 [Leptospira langatensis]
MSSVNRNILFLLLVLAECMSLNFCVPMMENRALVRRNPEPYPTGLGIPPDNDVSINGVNFRDPSIHFGASSTKLRTGVFDGLIRTTTSLPHKDMFHASLDGWDWSEHRIVRFEGESKGCQFGVRLFLPVKQGSNDSFIPIHFVFGRKSFYEELQDLMKEYSIEALFDSRLDVENTMYIFGLFRRKCLRFHSYGIQKF